MLFRVHGSDEQQLGKWQMCSQMNFSPNSENEQINLYVNLAKEYYYDIFTQL